MVYLHTIMRLIAWVEVLVAGTKEYWHWNE